LRPAIPRRPRRLRARSADPGAHRRVRSLPHRDGDALSAGRDRRAHDGPSGGPTASSAPLLRDARAELFAVLQADCGEDLLRFIARDTAWMPAREARRLYRERLTYGFDRVGAAEVPMDAPRIAASLLRTSHPSLTEAQRRQVLELTAI